MNVRTGLIYGKYEILDAISEYGTTSVYRVKSRQRILVAKVVRVQAEHSELAWASFESEVGRLKALRHPNIVRHYDCFRIGDNFIVISEFCAHGSLIDYSERTGPIRGQFLFQIIRELCEAVRYCWDHGVKHGALKPSNVFLDGDGRVRLGDFEILGRSWMDKFGGPGNDIKAKPSPVCVAPEAISGGACDLMKSGIWSIGVTILWLAKGSIPWQCDRMDEMLRLIRSGRCQVAEHVPADVAALVMRMMTVVPRDRELPTEEELKEIAEKAEMTRPERIGLAAESAFTHAAGQRQRAVNAQMGVGSRRGSVGMQVLKRISKTGKFPAVIDGSLDRVAVTMIPTMNYKEPVKLNRLPCGPPRFRNITEDD